MRVLGIDYGQRRIGLALSDATGMLARPWKVIPRQGNPSQVVSQLASLIRDLSDEDDGLGAVVIGLPRRLDGSPTDVTATVQAIGAGLARSIGVPVTFQDERLSSREAESLLSRRLKNWRDRKALLDAAAAAVILQDYLDARPREDSVL